MSAERYTVGNSLPALGVSEYSISAPDTRDDCRRDLSAKSRKVQLGAVVDPIGFRPHDVDTMATCPAIASIAGVFSGSRCV